jgi:hypothetical protein
MNNRITIVMAVVPVCCICIAASAGTFTVPEGLIDSCVFIMQGEEAKGTGFLIGVKDANSTFCYLVTAKHVLEPILTKQKSNISVRFNTKNSEQARTLSFPTLNFKGRPWLEHPNPAVDMAIVLLPIFDKVKELDVTLIAIDDPNSELLATSQWIKKYKVGPGDQAFTLGLVPFLYAFNKDADNLVLSRFGTVSLLIESEIILPGGKQRAIFLDCPAFPGSSGGPAFVLIGRSEKGPLLTGWRFGLLGVVTAFVPSLLRVAKIEVEETKQKSEILPLENTGISKVVPVDYLVDVLFSQDQRTFRENIISLKKGKSSNKSLEETR